MSSSKVDKQQIKGWLDQLGYGTEEVDDPEADFNIAVSYRNKAHGPAHIVAGESIPHAVLVIRGTHLSDELRQCVEMADSNSLAVFAARLKQHLLLSPAQYMLEFETGDDDIKRPVTLQVQIRIDDEELSRAKVDWAMGIVLKASMLFSVCAQEQFRILPG